MRQPKSNSTMLYKLLTRSRPGGNFQQKL